MLVVNRAFRISKAVFDTRPVATELETLKIRLNSLVGGNVGAVKVSFLPPEEAARPLNHNLDYHYLGVRITAATKKGAPEEAVQRLNGSLKLFADELFFIELVH